MITIIIGAWVVWVIANLALMILVRPDMAHFNGFRIHMPEWYLDRLTEEEYMAIYYHERGHQMHGHIWENFTRVCLFMRTSRTRRIQQELEADDYAAKLIRPEALASALRKLSLSPGDNVRARRLEMKGWQMANDLRTGMCDLAEEQEDEQEGQSARGVRQPEVPPEGQGQEGQERQVVQSQTREMRGLS